MYKYIDENLLRKTFQDPLWYIKLQDFLKEHFFEFNGVEGKTKEWLAESEEFLQFVAQLIKEQQIALSTFKYGLDKQRKPIDTVIIHHTSRDQDEKDIEYLEQSLTLVRIYAKTFSDSTKRFFGRPISSDYFYEGRLTFMPYHYFIWPDGSYKQYLEDSYVGWHAGNWDWNLRSIAIAFHDVLDNKEPTLESIEAAKEIIAKYKPQNILGHREVSNTTCPGNLFLGENGWKNKLQ